ncbi:hypothetical protein MRX96_003695 [Rhipicephalus microplus]
MLGMGSRFSMGAHRVEKGGGGNIDVSHRFATARPHVRSARLGSDCRRSILSQDAPPRTPPRGEAILDARSRYTAVIKGAPGLDPMSYALELPDTEADRRGCRRRSFFQRGVFTLR